MKAQAMDKWAKDAVTEDGILEAGQPLHSQPPKERERIMEPLFTTTPMDLKNRESRDKRNVEVSGFHFPIQAPQSPYKRVEWHSTSSSGNAAYESCVFGEVLS